MNRLDEAILILEQTPITATWIVTTKDDTTKDDTTEEDTPKPKPETTTKLIEDGPGRALFSHPNKIEIDQVKDKYIGIIVASRAKGMTTQHVAVMLGEYKYKKTADHVGAILRSLCIDSKKLKRKKNDKNIWTYYVPEYAVKSADYV